MSQAAIIVAMVGSSTSKKTADPSQILNAVCARGWELVNGSFVFVVEGEQSRDKFMASGQNVAVKGRTVGYYRQVSCSTRLLGERGVRFDTRPHLLSRQRSPRRPTALPGTSGTGAPA